jgi:hypothetical protein
MKREKKTQHNTTHIKEKKTKIVQKIKLIKRKEFQWLSKEMVTYPLFKVNKLDVDDCKTQEGSGEVSEEIEEVHEEKQEPKSI